MVNKPFIRPYFWEGMLGRGWLTSHEGLTEKLSQVCQVNFFKGDFLDLPPHPVTKTCKRSSPGGEDCILGAG